MDNKMSKNVLKDYIIKPAFVAGAGYVLTMAYLGEGGTVSFFGRELDAGVAVGLAAASGSIVSSLSHDYFLPHISSDYKLSNMESTILAPAASGLGALLLLGPIGGLINSDVYLQAFIVGAASELSGLYVYDYLLGKDGSIGYGNTPDEVTV